MATDVNEAHPDFARILSLIYKNVSLAENSDAVLHAFRDPNAPTSLSRDAPLREEVNAILQKEYMRSKEILVIKKAELFCFRRRLEEGENA